LAGVVIRGFVLGCVYYGAVVVGRCLGVKEKGVGRFVYGDEVEGRWGNE